MIALAILLALVGVLLVLLFREQHRKLRALDDVSVQIEKSVRATWIVARNQGDVLRMIGHRLGIDLHEIDRALEHGIDRDERA